MENVSPCSLTLLGGSKVSRSLGKSTGACLIGHYTGQNAVCFDPVARSVTVRLDTSPTCEVARAIKSQSV